MKRSELLEKLFEDIACIGRQIMPFPPSQVEKKLPTRAQLSILFFIFHNGPQNIKEVAHRFGMTPSAITQIVNTLEKEKLLDRTPDTTDKRKICVSLTTQGKKKLEEVKKIRMMSFKKVFDSLSEKELLQLRSIYSKILETLK